ncbi:IMPG1 protein, partial [Nycticryphes semicollaris]|nr:IMPG1 protein [Nycticryphes semicollaris]
MHLITPAYVKYIYVHACFASLPEIPNKINRGEAKHLADASGSDKTERTTKRSRVSTIRRIFDMSKHRIKRSSFFSTGVKVCPQESVKQILASHQAYYRLRVCQEAVWEAFRIFLDRIPDTSEYQNWVTACQRETFCIFDIGKNFSNSQEHLEIIQRRVKHRTFQERKDEISTEKTGGKKLEDIPSISTGSPGTSLSPYAPVPNGTLLNEIVNDTKTPVKELGTNTVPELPVEQMVEFSVTLTDQEYTAELDDPNSPQYRQLAAKFQLQMQKIFEKLPGFKEIRVLGFKSSSTIARYVVNFERDGSEIKSTADDISTIGSNKVENEKIPLSPKEESEISATKLTVTDLQQLVAIALHEDQSLPVDLGTLQFTDESIIPPSDFDNDIQGIVTIPLAGPDLEDSVNLELPLGYPSPATMDQTGDTSVNEFTTGTPVLSAETSAPEDLNNFITSEPVFPTKPSREPFQDRSHPYTEGIVTDHQRFTVPFDTLVSTSGPPKPEASYLPPPADNSASNDLITHGYEFPTEQATVLSDYTTGSFTPPNLLQARDETPEAEEKKELTDTTEPSLKEADQDSLSGQAVKTTDEPESSGDDILITASTYGTVPFFLSPTGLSTRQPEEVVTDLLPSHPTAPPFVATSPLVTEQALETFDPTVPASEPLPPDSTGMGVQDITAELHPMGAMSTAALDEAEHGSGYISVLTTGPAEATPAPTLKYVTTSSMTTAAKGKELVVFFSLRVTNMHFSDDLFNRSSTEYKALEQQFMQLLLPYLQSNLTGFKHLEILNFRNGSVIVNSKMKFARTVPYNITEAVHCVLEDFCDAAAQRLNLEIDSYSLDIEPADRADPCKFMACDEFSECVRKEGTKEAECLCKPGYASQDGLPCRSLCELQPHLCDNGGKCQLVPGRGAVCR